MADTPPKSDSSRSDREKRLAEALRANLRRRKAAARKPNAESTAKPDKSN